MTDNTTKAGALAAVHRTLMADYNAALDELLSGNTTITVAAELLGRRTYPMRAKPFSAVTIGTGVVISTSAERVPIVERIVDGKTRDYIFTNPVLGQFEQMVQADNQFVSGPVLRHICSKDHFRAATTSLGVSIEVLEGVDVQSLFVYPGFSEALSYAPDHPRRDSLAAVARRGSEVVAIAGANIDSPELWQIGVTVIDSAQGTGIGRAVVSRLTEAIFDAGVVPYYSTATTNIASRNLAQGLGFWPAWTEIFVTDLG
ncbi:hypothetical protein BH09CHL1_BH09CHL1_28400 [soil metagenome]